MSEAYDTVLNHLLFHKALVSERDGAERITRYVSMLNEIDQGMHVTLRDPFEKAVAASFELVLENQLDPWEMNLAEFTRMYLEKVKQGGPVNFVTAGKLVFMAWSILKLQSDRLLLAAQPPPPEEPAGDDGLEMYGEPEDLDFNQVVLGAGRVPLAEAIRREGRRAVTLMELVGAFDEARREAERQLQLNALREQAQKSFAPNFHTKVHSEDLSEDIGITWARLLGSGGAPIPLARLAGGGGRWDLITVFVSALFLAKMEKVKLWQDGFPQGEIFVQRIATSAPLRAEDLAAVPTGREAAGGAEAPAAQEATAW